MFAVPSCSKIIMLGNEMLHKKNLPFALKNVGSAKSHIVSAKNIITLNYAPCIRSMSRVYSFRLSVHLSICACVRRVLTFRVRVLRQVFFVCIYFCQLTLQVVDRWTVLLIYDN